MGALVTLERRPPLVSRRAHTHGARPCQLPPVALDVGPGKSCGLCFTLCIPTLYLFLGVLFRARARIRPQRCGGHDRRLHTDLLCVDPQPTARARRRGRVPRAAWVPDEVRKSNHLTGRAGRLALPAPNGSNHAFATPHSFSPPSCPNAPRNPHTKDRSHTCQHSPEATSSVNLHATRLHELFCLILNEHTRPTTHQACNRASIALKSHASLCICRRAQTIGCHNN